MASPPKVAACAMVVSPPSPRPLTNKPKPLPYRVVSDSGQRSVPETSTQRETTQCSGNLARHSRALAGLSIVECIQRPTWLCSMNDSAKARRCNCRLVGQPPRLDVHPNYRPGSSMTTGIPLCNQWPIDLELNACPSVSPPTPQRSRSATARRRAPEGAAPEQLQVVSEKLLQDLKAAREPLNQTPNNRARAPSRQAPWEREHTPSPEPEEERRDAQESPGSASGDPGRESPPGAGAR
jgi:hypothetical protein